MPKNLSASGGASPPDQGLCPWTSLGAPASDPLIGSRTALAMCRADFQIAPAASAWKLPSTYPHYFIRKVGYLQNVRTSLWYFVPNSGL